MGKLTAYADFGSSCRFIWEFAQKVYPLKNISLNLITKFKGLCLVHFLWPISSISCSFPPLSYWNFILHLASVAPFSPDVLRTHLLSLKSKTPFLLCFIESVHGTLQITSLKFPCQLASCWVLPIESPREKLGGERGGSISFQFLQPVAALSEQQQTVGPSLNFLPLQLPAPVMTRHNSLKGLSMRSPHVPSHNGACSSGHLLSHVPSTELLAPASMRSESQVQGAFTEELDASSIGLLLQILCSSITPSFSLFSQS